MKNNNEDTNNVSIAFRNEKKRIDAKMVCLSQKIQHKISQKLLFTSCHYE